jgi:hypothetical protein
MKHHYDFETESTNVNLGMEVACHDDGTTRQYITIHGDIGGLTSIKCDLLWQNEGLGVKS